MSKETHRSNFVKLLVSGLTQSGKTRLLSTDFGDEILVLAKDGKKYPYNHPHANIPNFNTVDELIDYADRATNMYMDKYGKLPEIIVWDTISKILLDIEASCIRRIKSYPYGEVNKEISKLLEFIEDMSNSCDVIIMSHSIWDADENLHKLVNAGGSYGKKGGVISEVDNSIFLEIKGTRVTVWQQNPSKLARTTIADIAVQVPYKDYSLKEHVIKLREQAENATSNAFIL